MKTAIAVVGLCVAVTGHAFCQTNAPRKITAEQFLDATNSDAEAAKVAAVRAKAENGDAQSQLELGSAFDFGTFGVAKDKAEAVKWYRKAAEQNLAVAQLFLGISYAIGEGVAKDEAEAVKWYRKAAKQGDAAAQNFLGVCYLNGRGVENDSAEAVKWFRKAADQNYAAAQIHLGVCYINGEGVKKDEVEAVKWYRKAAEQGDAAAQYFLGGCYFLSHGLPQDLVEAAKWLNLASAQGDENAKKGLPQIEHYMTPEQIAEGKRRANRFTPVDSKSNLTAPFVDSIRVVTRTKAPLTVPLPDPLTTTSGKTYNSTKLVRVYPSYITISYVNADYVVDLENVRFETLSTNLQAQFGYDRTNAMLFDAMENKEAAFWKTFSMTPNERKWYDYHQILLRRQDEIDQAAAAAAAARQQEADDLKRRQVAAQEKAAQAAMIQALNPPVIIQQQQRQ